MWLTIRDRNDAPVLVTDDPDVIRATIAAIERRVARGFRASALAERRNGQRRRRTSRPIETPGAPRETA